MILINAKLVKPLPINKWVIIFYFNYKTTLYNKQIHNKNRVQTRIKIE